MSKRCKTMLYGYWQLFTHIKTDNFYEDIADNAEKRFYTSNHEVDRPLLRGKNKWWIMKDELEEKKCVIKRILQFNDHKDWLFKNEIKWY